MGMIADAAQRSAALDATQSFCVSAPAGSGKTELLIQRYLKLLARVERPEQILAITFTKKAAAEMRERVRASMLAARDDLPVASDHEQVTRELAIAALAADAAHGWQLLRDFSRFNIKTIDSFCAGLTQQMPVLSQLGGQLTIEEDVQPLYEEAVTALFGEIDGAQAFTSDLAALMLHFDNDWERLKDRLVSMLGRRDQWKSYVNVRYDPDESERHLVTLVEGIVAEHLGAVARHLAPYESELLTLQNYAAHNLGEDPLESFPGTSPGALRHWQKIAALLVTGQGTWRKSMTKTFGFPKEGDLAVQRKDELKALLADLQQISGLEALLAQLPGLPQIQRDSDAWQLVLHLSRLLPILAAQLLLIFRKHQAVDYSQIAQSAILALGEDDAPTDLALRLDYRIEHILVDEFQDTAVTQFELLEKLTRGWGDHNAQHPERPRTLFIVGDGMQSIYAFRGANVGLLVKAQQEGFNGVSLSELELTSNFRSEQGIVDWVNKTFVHAFPAQNNANLAQVKFSAASPVKGVGQTPAVTTQFFSGEGSLDAEMDVLCQSIGKLQSDFPEQSIAILGRSRTQLQPLIARLKAHNIDFHAQDLDGLAQSPAIADLLVLCRVMANGADRLAWMSALRAPWCGLSLADLLVITQRSEHPRYASFWQLLGDDEVIASLSEDGEQRLRSIRTAFLAARETRERLALRAWLERLWESLQGPASVFDELALEDISRFMTLVELADAEGKGLDVAWLERKLEKLFMAGGNVESTVQIMTLHKAKGLEFDHVIIPQIARGTKGDGRDLLLWDEYSDSEGNRGFLLAADDREKKGPTLYNFLSARRKEKARLENTRLLYVGATRAVKSLLLTGCLTLNEKDGSVKPPAQNSLLHSIWGAISDGVQPHLCDAAPEVLLPASRKLVRLEQAAMPSGGASLPAADVGQANQPEPDTNLYERIVGTVVHLAMEQLSRQSPLPDGVSELDLARWRMALQGLGLWSDALKKAEADVQAAVTQSLRAGGQGRWLLSSDRSEASSELPLSMVDSQNAIVELVIDRTFVDEDTGVRWVVDYKNSRPVEGQAQDDFMRGEAERYRDQLTRYRDAVQLMDGRPVKCALFFTALGELWPLPELDNT